MYNRDGKIHDDLRELTGQESGIVIYDGEIIVVNWATECSNGGMPLLSPVGGLVIEWPHDEPLIVSEVYRIDDLRAMLDGDDDYKVALDEFGDIPALFGVEDTRSTVIKDEAGNLMPTAAVCYKIDNAIVIAPEGWN